MIRGRAAGSRPCGTIACVPLPSAPEETPGVEPAPRQVLRQPGRRVEPHGHAPPAPAAAQADGDLPLLRGREVVSHGTGWVERIVVDADDTSTYFTPLAITLNIDSFEHLEFETRPDQLLVYTLVQGDERVIVEFAPIGPRIADDSPFAPRQLAFDTSEYVQMELQGLDVRADERLRRPRSPRTYGRPSAAGAPTRLRTASREPMTTTRMTIR